MKPEVAEVMVVTAVVASLPSEVEARAIILHTMAQLARL